MKIKEFKEESIIFDNDYKLEYYHEQDCCESVYAEFEILKDYNVSLVTGKNIDIKEIDFEESLTKLVEGVKEAGFNMVSKIGEKFFVPCYNSQNGYYSGDLELILYKENNVREELDISDFVEDDIY
ncbi:MAG: hypothetical protein HFJ52_03125 [Clostridia bacterium]|nr:hypothetical protein [Clostridia bacterium]